LVASWVQRWIGEEIIVHLLPFRSLDLDYKCKISFGSSRPHCFKIKFYQSISGPIFKQCKPIILGNKRHLYSMVDINTQNRATFYLVIDTLKICSHVTLLQNPKPFPLVPLLSHPIPHPLMLLLMFKQDKDLT
jgi:hypothetical protein